MRITLQRQIPDDEALRRQWNDLVLRMESAEVFYTCEWACAVQAAYRNSVKPLLFLGQDNEKLVAVAALATDAGQETVSFLAGTTADYCDFISDPKDRAAFLNGVLEKLKESGFRDITLANLPAESATAASLRRMARKHGFHTYMRPAYLCAQVDLRQGVERDRLKTRLQQKKKLKYYLRAMEREGPVTIKHHQAPESIAEALPRFINAHVGRFEATGRISNLATAERRRFLAELTERFGGTTTVTLTEMSVGGRPMAWNFGFQFQGSWFWYMPTFDTRDEASSPGYCLLAQIIIEACDRPELRVVDLGLGAEGYKERFGNSCRHTLHTTLTRSRAKHWQEVARYRAASAIKKSPKIETAVRGVRDALRRATYKKEKNRP